MSSSLIPHYRACARVTITSTFRVSMLADEPGVARDRAYDATSTIVGILLGEKFPIRADEMTIEHVEQTSADVELLAFESPAFVDVALSRSPYALAHHEAVRPLVIQFTAPPERAIGKAYSDSQTILSSELAKMILDLGYEIHNAWRGRRSFSIEIRRLRRGTPDALRTQLNMFNDEVALLRAQDEGLRTGHLLTTANVLAIVRTRIDDPSVDLRITRPEVAVERSVCSGCGCTEEKACEGGCSWIALDLCSQCVNARSNDHLELYEVTP